MNQGGWNPAIQPARPGGAAPPAPLGHMPPWMTPELFAPELFDEKHGYDMAFVFSPDSTETVWNPMELEGSSRYSKLVGGTWLPPQKVNFGLNVGVGDATYLFIRFKNSEGSWTKAIDMGAKASTEHHDLCASASPDGKCLFFLSQREGKHRICRVDERIIKNFKSE